MLLGVKRDSIGMNNIRRNIRRNVIRRDETKRNITSSFVTSSSIIPSSKTKTLILSLTTLISTFLLSGGGAITSLSYHNYA